MIILVANKDSLLITFKYKAIYQLKIHYFADKFKFKADYNKSYNTDHKII